MDEGADLAFKQVSSSVGITDLCVVYRDFRYIVDAAGSQERATSIWLKEKLGPSFPGGLCVCNVRHGRLRCTLLQNLQDFGDGGAFPEIHVAQYPMNMGKKKKAVSLDL